MPTATSPLPHWDTSPFFPGLDSPEFYEAFAQISRDLQDLEGEFDRIGVRKGGSADAKSFDAVVNAMNSLSERIRTVNAYIALFVTTNSRDEAAQARDSEMDAQLVAYRKLGQRLTAWLGTSDVERLLDGSEVARAHEFVVRKAKTGAEHQMSPEEEALAADLEVTGSSAWQKLHANVTSQLMVRLEKGEEPMSSVRNLAHSPDRAERRAAYEAELEAWQGVEVPLAAALNGVKGEVLTLSKRRKWDSPLDAALFGTNIDRETLDAMMTAARESYPIFRRYLDAKARAIGVGKLAWYDLFAPVGGSERQWEYEEAIRFVIDGFRTYSEKMGDFAARSHHERWTDAEPRPGKVDGAFCMGVRADESRILMNFKPSFGSVSTLAHELGHGYHNLCLFGRTAMQRATPMTLAETASIFCETIIREASLSEASRTEKISILEASLQGTCQVVVDISSRFLFEQSIFEMRAKRELSSQEFCERMLQAQRDTYGDGLDSQLLHPYMWAVKSHYYGRSYYNFPYMFGLLFGLGLYAIYKRDGDSFRSRYDVLLSSTGLADAATLAGSFGIDIRTPDFWRASLDRIRQDVDEFESLIA